MAHIANAFASDGRDLTTTEISAFAESVPSVAQIIGWLSARCSCYVYLAQPDGEPVFHAGESRIGEPSLIPIPGEELTLAVVGEVDNDALAQVALILSVALARRSADSMIAAKTDGDLLRSLLVGEDDVLDRAIAQGWDVDRAIVVLVGRFPDGDLFDIAEQWRALIKQRDPKGQVFFFPSEIVALIGAESSPQLLAESLARHGGGLSYSTAGTIRADLRQMYRQCELAIQVASRLGRGDQIVALDQLGSYRLLALVNDSDALRQFLDDTLHELAVRRDLDAVDLRRTLQVLLDLNLNIAETARVLHFHYNTLRYRIAKLKKMLGEFDTDPELRLSISLALRILSLRGL